MNGYAFGAVVVSAIFASLAAVGVAGKFAKRDLAETCIHNGGEWRQPNWYQPMSCVRSLPEPRAGIEESAK